MMAIAAGWHDIIDGFKNWRTWLMLGWQDVRLRYRRSHIGPFWITLSMSTMLYTMGFLYGHLFHMQLAKYFPYLAISLLGWYLIAAIVTDTTSAFLESAHYIAQIKLPSLTYVMRVIIRNTVIFFHNVLAVIPVLIYYQVHLGWRWLLIGLGLILIVISGIIYGMILAILGTRYRDLQQFINSLIQVLFLVTPVMWMPQILPANYQWIVNYNPLAQLLELMRFPLTTGIPIMHAYLFVLQFIAIGFLIMLYLLGKSRHRIVFWL